MSIDRASERLVLTRSDDGAHVLSWALDDLRRVGDTADGALHLYKQGADDAQRIVVGHKQAIVIVETLAKSLDSKDMSWAIWRKIGLWTSGAVAAICLMIFVIIPSLAGLLAPMIPADREARIGASVLAQIEKFLSDSENGDWFCTDSDGQAALEKMTQVILGDQDIPYDLSVQITDLSMINAFALPGGHVVLMDGLLQAADTPGQVAGVLAHELAHVYYRDPIEQTLRAAGTAGLLSLVLGDVSGGTVIAIVGEQALNSSYSRRAEARADDFALYLMEKANVNPEDFAAFFDTLQAEMGDAADMEHQLEWFSTHPNTQGRANNARRAIEPGRTYENILTDKEWASLQAMCG
ncbi:MAG: M48 family metallopeptidase [Pseudomonadota bacterium]